ncbi:hypothetical protein C1H46_043807 [Malus baccata]|uniref:Uncharacterized protein n=1 Tax=Malus baccata TaxID=106549 RepID=A0A540K8V7_MALBA|nr:hypothetical protein C1H46_043807 [Malus baccata]
MHRAPTFLPARVFPTPSPSPCYLPLPTVFFDAAFDEAMLNWGQGIGRIEVHCNGGGCSGCF